jgi:hypothetical protein
MPVNKIVNERKGFTYHQPHLLRDAVEGGKNENTGCFSKFAHRPVDFTCPGIGYYTLIRHLTSQAATVLIM